MSPDSSDPDRVPRAEGQPKVFCILLWAALLCRNESSGEAKCEFPVPDQQENEKAEREHDLAGFDHLRILGCIDEEPHQQTNDQTEISFLAPNGCHCPPNHCSRQCARLSLPPRYEIPHQHLRNCAICAHFCHTSPSSNPL